jgi:uncharacterized SAM-binding protein YcdF (DUF218 family)
MYTFFSSLFKALIYPLGLACLGLLLALILQSKKRWRNILTGVALAILWLGGSRYVAIPLAYSLEWQNWPIINVPAVDTVVVLSGGTDGPTYPRPAVEQDQAGARILYAYRLYQQGVAPYLLLSGSQASAPGTPESLSSAQGMADILQTMGVPGQAIWQDNDSLNTYQSAVNCAKILKQKDVRQVVLVTSAIHMPRAIGVFKKQGVDVFPAPTDFDMPIDALTQLTHGSPLEQIGNFFPSLDYLNLTTDAIKEYLGIAVYRLLGWI